MHKFKVIITLVLLTITTKQSCSRPNNNESLSEKTQNARAVYQEADAAYIAQAEAHKKFLLLPYTSFKQKQQSATALDMMRFQRDAAYKALQDAEKQEKLAAQREAQDAALALELAKQETRTYSDSCNAAQVRALMNQMSSEGAKQLSRELSRTYQTACFLCSLSF